MCGIVGYIGNRQAAGIVLNALHKLEYRGYDSAGIATIADGCLSVRKDTGKLSEVNEKHHLHQLPGEVGIGHVRWATHGAVTIANSHPHLDCKHEIAIVHNGIIENTRELAQRLDSRHKFVSETDTEVIVHLIEDYVANGSSLEDAVRLVGKELKGSYAIAAISAREPDRIVALRKDSPLVVGLGNEGNFVASDTLSFLNETDRVIFLEDGEQAVITRDKVSVFDSEGRQIDRAASKFDWEWDEVTKQGHDFFMLKEILEQPQAMRRAVMQDRTLMMEMALEILRAKQVVFTACGTSRYAALIGRYAFSKISGKFSDVVIASEFGYFADSIDKNTLVIAVSQSGETADVMDGVKRAKENGATVFSLVNAVGSSLARASDRVVYLNCGPEIGVAATKSFMAQLTVLYLLAYTMVNRYDEGASQLEAVSKLIETNLQHNGQEIPRIAAKMNDKNDFYYIARGINFAVAGEGALKLKEIAYVHAEGMPAGELKHGTLALVEKGTPVVAICPADYTFDEMLSNIAETKARGALVLGVSDRNDLIFDEWIRIPEVGEIFYPLVAIIPLQLFAYHSAINRGLDPDMPRNLAKSVTVK